MNFFFFFRSQRNRREQAGKGETAVKRRGALNAKRGYLETAKANMELQTVSGQMELHYGAPK